MKNNNFLRREKRTRFQLNKKRTLEWRLVVHRSNMHIYAQVINDSKAITIVSASSIENTFPKDIKSKTKKSQEVGKLIAQRALKNNVSNVVFDKGAYKYHGCIQILADSARSGGLKF